MPTFVEMDTRSTLSAQMEQQVGPVILIDTSDPSALVMNRVDSEGPTRRRRIFSFALSTGVIADANNVASKALRSMIVSCQR